MGKGYINNRREVARHAVRWYKSAHPCVDCGEADPICLTFDHVNGDKDFTIGEAISVKLTTLLREMQKCEVVCANCHFKRSHRQRPAKAAPIYRPKRTRPKWHYQP